MGKILKTFGKGILYILVLPFLLVALAIYVVINTVIFICLSLRDLIFLFLKKNPDLLREDKKAQAILNKQAGNDTSIKEEPIKVDETLSQNNMSVIEPIAGEPGNQNQQDFYKPEYLKPKIEEVIVVSEPEVEDLFVPTLEEKIIPIEETKEEEEQQKEDENTKEESPSSKDEEEIQEEIDLPKFESIKTKEEEEIIKTYVPRSSKREIFVEDDDDDSGVDIF